MKYGINDPSALLRPFRNLQQFTEELYAMHSRLPEVAADQTEPVKGEKAQEADQARLKRDDSGDGTPSINAIRQARLEAARPSTVTSDLIRADPHSAARRTPQEAQEEASRPRDTPKPEAPQQPTQPAPSSPRPRVTDVTTVIEQRKRAAAGADDQHAASRRTVDQTDHSQAPIPKNDDYSPASRERSAPGKDGKDGSDPIPTRRDRPDLSAFRSQETSTSHYDRDPKPAEPTKRYEPEFTPKPVLDIGDFASFTPPGGSGGTTVFMGKVTSGTGATYQVTLYPDGPTGDPQTPDVTVTITMIDPTDTIPPATWLASVFQFTDTNGNDIYFCQVPVWVA